MDEAVLDFFEMVALDVEATRERIEEQSDRLVREAQAMRKQAEREAMRSQQATARIRGYVGEGRLGPDELELAKSDEDAAQAELDRLAEQERAAEAMPKLADTDELLLVHLTRIPEAVSGRIQDADTIEAVRAALVLFFTSLVVHDSNSDSVFETEAPGVYIEPVIEPGTPFVPMPTSDNDGFTT